MRSRLLVFVVVGCGGPSGDARVADLSGSDQQSVCEDFVDTICSKPNFVNFCTPCAKGTGCAMAVTANAIDAECGVAPDASPVTVGMVEDCADSGDIAVCVKGGGCMIDAIEAVCP